MNDLADRADSEVEHEQAEALRQRKPGGPPPPGWCHYCAEPLEPGWRWCGHGCEDEWSRERERRRVNGERQ